MAKAMMLARILGGCAAAGLVAITAASTRPARAAGKKASAVRGFQVQSINVAQGASVPGNVIVESWFPQPSVIPQVDAVIHHGGNNSFTECLYFGKPAIIMPYVWDGHDNATRVQETGHGFGMPRYDWSDAELAAKIEACLTDPQMKAKLAKTSAQMHAQNGPEKAAGLLEALL